MTESDVSRRPHDIPGTIVAGLFVCLGVFLITQTGGMTPLGSVFPITISAAMIAFAAILIVRNVVIGLRRRPAASLPAAPLPAAPLPAAPLPMAPPTPREPQPEAQPAHESWPRMIGFLLVMALWIVLMPVLGFFVSSLVSFFAITAIAIHERIGLREGIVLAILGIAILTGFYLIMADVLLLPLPRGMFF